MIVLGFNDYEAQAQRLAQSLGVPAQTVDVHRFPDDEVKVTLPADKLPEHVVICRSLDRPNDKLIELLLTSATARTCGAQRLTLVAPYMCYMRQDTAFHPGEAVSQKIIGAWLAQQFDNVITVDPHLHRIQRLSQAIPAATARALSAAPLMADFLKARLDHPYILGPDQESKQWVKAIADNEGLDYGVATKQRRSDRDVEISLPDVTFKGRDVVIVDDVISTGHTLCETAKRLRRAHVNSVHCLITHALCAGDAARKLKDAGVDNFWSTDSIDHSSNAVLLADLLKSAVQDLNSN